MCHCVLPNIQREKIRTAFFITLSWRTFCYFSCFFVWFLSQYTCFRLGQCQLVGKRRKNKLYWPQGSNYFKVLGGKWSYWCWVILSDAEWRVYTWELSSQECKQYDRKLHELLQAQICFFWMSLFNCWYVVCSQSCWCHILWIVQCIFLPCTRFRCPRARWSGDR